MVWSPFVQNVSDVCKQIKNIPCNNVQPNGGSISCAVRSPPPHVSNHGDQLQMAHHYSSVSELILDQCGPVLQQSLLIPAESCLRLAPVVKSAF